MDNDNVTNNELNIVNDSEEPREDNVVTNDMQDAAGAVSSDAAPDTGGTGLDDIVGFKAVGADGKERDITLDELTALVSTRMVASVQGEAPKAAGVMPMAAGISTFAVAAATGNDVYENELPVVTDCANVRVLNSAGDPCMMTKQAMASLLGGLLGVSSSTILFKGKGYIQLETEDDIDKVYEPGVYAIKGASYNDQTLLVFSHNLGQSTVQFRTNNYGGFLMFRIKWWSGAWGTWKTVSLT